MKCQTNFLTSPALFVNGFFLMFLDFFIYLFLFFISLKASLYISPFSLLTKFHNKFSSLILIHFYFRSSIRLVWFCDFGSTRRILVSQEKGLPIPWLHLLYPFPCSIYPSFLFVLYVPDCVISFSSNLSWMRAENVHVGRFDWWRCQAPVSSSPSHSPEGTVWRNIWFSLQSSPRTVHVQFSRHGEVVSKTKRNLCERISCWQILWNLRFLSRDWW